MREWLEDAIAMAVFALFGHLWSLACLIGVALLTFVVTEALLLARNAGPFTWRLW